MVEAQSVAQFMKRDRAQVSKGRHFQGVEVIIAGSRSITDGGGLSPGVQGQTDLIFASSIREEGREARIERVGNRRPVPMQMVVRVRQYIREGDVCELMVYQSESVARSHATQANPPG